MMVAPGFVEKYGPWALVVGGTKGIGVAYSRHLASLGMNLVITARGQDELDALADELPKHYGVEVKTVALDLNDPDVVESLRPVVDELEVGLLIYNAAYYDIRPFMSSAIDDHLRTLNVNCRSLLLMIHYFGGLMCERKRGGIIVMSSMSGWHGAGLLATYAATKAFDTVLGEGLWEELREYGVDVLAFVAGATKTPNFLSMTPEEKQKDAFPMEPQAVAREALAKLGKKPIERAGPVNKLAGQFLLRLLSRRQAVQLMSSANRKLYGD